MNNKKDVGTFFHLHGTKITPYVKKEPKKQRVVIVRPKPKPRKIFINKNFLKKNPGNCKERKKEYYERQQLQQKTLNWSPYEIEGNNLRIWSAIVRFCKVRRIHYVIDLGCGAGHFAKLLKDGHKELVRYWGYDFSSVSITKGRRMLDNRFSLEIEDVLDIDFTKDKPKNAIYTAFEFLEHINDDIKVVLQIPRNTWFCFSVPNYWTPDHVRVFQTYKDIKERYNKYFKQLYIKAYTFEIHNDQTIIQFLVIGRT